MKDAIYKAYSHIQKRDVDFDDDSYQEQHNQKQQAKKSQQNRDKARKLKRG